MSDFYTYVNRYKGQILYRGYANGRKEYNKVPFKPALYFNDKNGNKRSIYGHKLSPMRFNSISDAREFMSRNKGIAGFEIYGTTDYAAQYVQEKWPGDVHYDEKLIHVLNIDIEVLSDEGFPHAEHADWPVDLITAKSSKSGAYEVFSLYQWDESKTYIEDDGVAAKVNHRHFDCEEDLLEAFLNYWTGDYPDIVTGWNVQRFDVLYLYNRIVKLLGEPVAKLLSPWSITEFRTMKDRFGKEKSVIDVIGVSQVDFMEVFRKFGYKYGPQENYKLDTICNTVLGTAKLSYDEYGSLRDLAKNNTQKYTDYNIVDVYRVEQMIEKTGLMSLVLDMAYRAGANIMDVFGTTRIWDTIIYRRLMEDGVVVQPMKSNPKVKYEGAYVKEIPPSHFTYVASFDISSLYPNIMIEWNMSPETLVPEMIQMNVTDALNEDIPIHPDGQYTVAANGARFRKDKQGYIPKILEEYYSDRQVVQAQETKLRQEKEDKKGKLSKSQEQDLDMRLARLFNQQMSIKILINSLYGAIGNSYFRHYDLKIAEGITMTGQMIIQWAQKYINKVVNKVLNKSPAKDYVCYVDTDSNYIDMSEIIKKFKPEDPISFMDSVCKEGIAPALSLAFQSMSARFNTFKPRMKMGREMLADRAVWTSKKRYAMRVWDDDGVRLSEPYYKIMGLEAVKSSTPGPVRKWMKEYIGLALSDKEEEADDFIDTKREEFVNMEPEDIAFPRTVNIGEWKLGDKGIPIHIRAALTYNHILTESGLDKLYPLVYDGDKIKFMYLVTPNPTKENVIAFPDVLPRETGLLEYIDYQSQFDKSFIAPMEDLQSAMGWHSSAQSTL